MERPSDLLFRSGFTRKTRQDAYHEIHALRATVEDLRADLAALEVHKEEFRHKAVDRLTENAALRATVEELTEALRIIRSAIMCGDTDVLVYIDAHLNRAKGGDRD